MSTLKIPSEERTETAKPEGKRASFHRKLPYNKVVVTAEETEQLIPSVSKKLFHITCAFSVFESLKNSAPSAE